MRNCWQLCLAHLLATDLVPDFVAIYPDNWLAHAAQWLQERDITLVAQVAVLNTWPYTDLRAVVQGEAAMPYIEVIARDGIPHARVVGPGQAVYDPLGDSPADCPVLGRYWLLRKEDGKTT